MEYFLDSFGDITIGNAAILLCAAIFLFGCYKKVGKYFSDKATKKKNTMNELKKCLVKQKGILNGTSKALEYEKI